MLVVDRLAWDTHPDLSFTVGDGERLYVCGSDPNEMATLLLAVAGFVPGATGQVTLDGRPLAGLPAPSRHISYVPSGDSLLADRSLRANMLHPAGAAWLARFGLPPDRSPRGLSHAQRRLAVLARALAASPAALAVVEAAGDGGAIPDALASEATPLALVASAEPALALSRAQRILLLHEGRIVQAGSPADLFDRPATAFAAKFFGPCNLLPADLGVGMPVRARDISAAILAIRPHRIRLAASGVAGRLTSIDYLGATTQLRIDVGGVAVLAHAAHVPDLPTGAAVHIAWDDAWPLPG